MPPDFSIEKDGHTDNWFGSDCNADQFESLVTEISEKRFGRSTLQHKWVACLRAVLAGPIVEQID